jgi:hypothetical protein
METLDRDILNMLADFDEEIMRDTAEEEMFERAVQRREFEGVFDDIFGG